MKNTLTRSEQDEHGTWWYIQTNGTRQRAKVKTCQTCGDLFLGYPHGGSAHCSFECYRKKCVRCGLDFPAKTVRQVYCSDVCKRGSKCCEACGKVFVPSKNAEGRFCSQTCHYEATCPIGTIRDGGNGYKIIKVPKDTPGAKRKYGPGGHQWMWEHRWVMQQKLGRALEAKENVHHINGKRDDNSPENLELWKRSQPAGVRAADYHCAGCTCFVLPRN